MVDDLDFSKIFSFSKISAYEQCPKRYHFLYLDPETSPRKKEFIKPRDYKTRGQAVHDAITLFYHLPKRKRNFANLKKCLAKSWYTDKDPTLAPPLGELGGFKNIEHERKTYLDSIKILKKFFSLKEIDPPLFLNPSENIRNSFGDYKDMIKEIGNGIFISGKFDRIDELKNGNLKIIDYKTSKEKDGYFQLEFYKLLAELNFKKKVDLVSFYFLDQPKIVSFDFSKVDTEVIRDKIVKKIEAVSGTENFLPKKNFFCSHCDFLELCPIFLDKNKQTYIYENH